MTDDETSRLSLADRAILTELETAWQRGGAAGLRTALARLAESDVVGLFRVLDALYPKEARKALEDAIIDAGLTDAGIRAMAERAKHKH